MLDEKPRALGLRREQAKLAEGWSRHEAGNMIPPSWRRVGE